MNDVMVGKQKGQKYLMNQLSFSDYKSDCATPNSSTQRLDKFKMIAGLKFKPRELTRYCSKRKTPKKSESLKPKGKLRQNIRLRNDFETLRKAYRINDPTFNDRADLSNILNLKKISFQKQKFDLTFFKSQEDKYSSQVENRIRRYNEAKKLQECKNNQTDNEEIKIEKCINIPIDSQLDSPPANFRRSSIIDAIYKPRLDEIDSASEKLTMTPKRKIKRNESLETRIMNKVISYCQKQYSEIK